MMRLGMVIAVLAAMAMGLVHVRRAKVRTRHEIQTLRLEQISLRRRLWDQEVRIGQLTTPERIRFRAAQMPLGLVAKHKVPEQFVTDYTRRPSAGRRPLPE